MLKNIRLASIRANMLVRTGYHKAFCFHQQDFHQQGVSYKSTIQLLPCLFFLSEMLFPAFSTFSDDVFYSHYNGFV